MNGMLTRDQVERFIESIYPSEKSKELALRNQQQQQQAPVPAPVNEKTAKQLQDAKEAKQDLSAYIILSVHMTKLLTISPSLHAPGRDGSSFLVIGLDGKCVDSTW